MQTAYNLTQIPVNMSEKHDPVFNPLSWTLILMLAGLYALYSWYQGNLKESLESLK